MVDSKITSLSVSPIAIIGAGTLGRRIALMMSAHGANIRLYDEKSESTYAAMNFVHAQLPILLSKTGNAEGKIEVSNNIEEAVKDVWLIIEAIPEVLDLKISLFAQLDRLAPAEAILASNSSSYPASKLIKHVSDERRTRVVNTHFYMPPVQNAVEIGGCEYTEKSVIEKLIKKMSQYGFFPFVVLKESMGFIFNRVWAAVKRECLEVVATGVSTPEDIDAIYKVNLGAQYGPFEMMDRIGLDVVYHIEKNYVESNPALSELPLKLLDVHISHGHLGIKAGRGFYQYDNKGNKITTN